MKTKLVKVDFPFYEVVKDSSIISKRVGEGRLIPALIIDIVDDIEVYELFNLHKFMPPGDIHLQWTIPVKAFYSSINEISLIIEFVKPMKMIFGIKFNISEHYAVIDGIIQSRGLYLMAGKCEDNVFKNIEDGILLEVPSMDFDNKWNKIFQIFLNKKYLKAGVPKKELPFVLNEDIKNIREIYRIRVNK